MIVNNMVFQFVSSTAYLFACLCLGVFILRKIQQRNNLFSPSALVFSSLSFILGAGIISSIWLLLALFGLFRNRFILPILAICVLLGISYIKQLMIDAVRQLKKIWVETRTFSWSWQLIISLSLD